MKTLMTAVVVLGIKYRQIPSMPYAWSRSLI